MELSALLNSPKSKKMTKTLTQAPIIPVGYTGRNFNKWQKKIQKELDKINNTKVATKLVA